MRGGPCHAIATLGLLPLLAGAWPTAAARRLVPEPRSRGMRYAARILLAIALAFAPAAVFSAQTRDSFDHLTTGFELIGQHRDLPCESCHANAVFKGTPRDCASCHGVGTAIRATAKTATHILSTQHCEGCHTPVAWRPAVNFDHAEAQGSCSTCHNNVQAQGKSPRHIDTNLECDVCHSSLSWAGAVFSHSGITSGCAACHNGVKATGVPTTHIPTNGAPCEDCHSSTNFTTFAGTPMNHATVAGISCAACHEAGKSFFGVTPRTRPGTPHPTSGDCSECHGSTTSFTSDSLRPANHIPTTAPCAQCHINPSDFTAYSLAGTHQGISGCLSCHGPTVAGSFANITITSTPGNHIPIGSLDCNGSGCHGPTQLNPGGFNIGTPSVNAPTLSTAGHATVATAVPSCNACHQTASYLGMIPSASAAGDSRPSASLDAAHPASGECGSCHTTTPTFASDVTSGGKPANHIPTSAPCAQCHTTAGNNALYSLTGTHQGVTNCLSCHGPTVAATFANVTITSTPGSHIPIGSLDCNGSGCHSTTNVNPGGFVLGTANINSPTLTTAGHSTIAAAVGACQTCHETAPYLGMLASSATAAGDSRPTALDKTHPTSGDCSSCHTTTPTFANDVTAAKPSNHIPTNAPCAQCHTTAGNYALYSVAGTHKGVTNCLSCHGPTVATTFTNVTITTSPGNHIPIGSLDCKGSGCHSTSNVNPGGFNIGTANINNPTLTTAGHSTIAAAVGACQTCHETAPYLGMLASSATSAADSRPTAFDKSHPTSGDCTSCHTTTPTFASDVTAAKPANHIPTNAPCAQCHTTAGNYAVYSVTGTHKGVTNCLSCHGPTVATTFANVTITTSPGNHIPIGSLDCNGSGCHSTSNVNPGGFNIGTANINNPTLTTAGHSTIAAAVGACQTCHETAPYLGMLASSATSAADSRPTAFDKGHPTSGDCNSCHTTTPTFTTDVTGGSKPANHIPTNAPCAQCHTTAGNYAVYSVTGTHKGVTNCQSCHGSTVAATFANVTITATPGNHIPIGSLDCNGSGCHSTSNVNPGGFNIGTANINNPTLTTAGHSTVAAAVGACQTCHETAPYLGMLASSATSPADSRPTAFDKSHPTSGDCRGCHTTTPTFASDVTSVAKPANHIPTNAPCGQCHTTAGNYAAYVMGATGHTGITSGCAQCHADGLSFANMAPPTLVEPPTGPTGHVPVGAVACEQCHSVTNFATFSGTVMKHAAVLASACDSCHEYGMTWKTNTGVRLWVRPSPSHHAGVDCRGAGCHTSRDKRAIRLTPASTQGNASTTSGTTAANSASAPATSSPAVIPRTGITAGASAFARAAQAAAPATVFVPGASAFGLSQGINHQMVGGRSCFSCHNQLNASGKPADHPATTNNCQSCHTTLAWLPVSAVDHTQMKGTCASCHNGRTARGKPSAHISSNATCETCHTTNAWTPARFEHSAILAGGCTSCHNSVKAVGLPRMHIPTSQQCDSCHGTLSWLPARLNHTAFVAGCPTCHNQVNAVGKPANHLGTLRDCATCHSYPDWSVVHFKHVSAAYPGDHRAVLSCTSCHKTDTESIPYAAPANAGTCGGCHASAFRPDAHPATAKGDRYTATELRNCSGACHVYIDSTRSKIIKSVPGPHHRVTDATFRR